MNIMQNLVTKTYFLKKKKKKERKKKIVTENSREEFGIVRWKEVLKGGVEWILIRLPLDLAWRPYKNFWDPTNFGTMLFLPLCVC